MTINRLKLIFSKHVLENRLRLNMTQQEVADATSVTLRWIQRIESGAKLPGFFLAIQLILLLEIDVNTLLRELKEGEQKRTPKRR